MQYAYKLFSHDSSLKLEKYFPAYELWFILQFQHPGGFTGELLRFQNQVRRHSKVRFCVSTMRCCHKRKPSLMPSCNFHHVRLFRTKWQSRPKIIDSKGYRTSVLWFYQIRTHLGTVCPVLRSREVVSHNIHLERRNALSTDSNSTMTTLLSLFSSKNYYKFPY